MRRALAFCRGSLAPFLVSYFFTPLAFALRAVSGVAVLACVGYFVSIVYGMLAGDALPTATIFRLLPMLASIEPSLPVAILLLAAAGTVLAWAASFGVLPVVLVQETERRMSRLWGLCGLPAILALFLVSLSAGGWSDHIRPGDQNAASLAGLIPHADALSYYSDTFRLALWGTWGGDALASAGRSFPPDHRAGGRIQLYRHVARASRSVGGRAVPGGTQPGAMAWAVGRYRVCRFHHEILARPFLATTLTEPLALVLTLAAIVFLLDALRLRSAAACAARARRRDGGAHHAHGQHVQHSPAGAVDRIRFCRRNVAAPAHLRHRLRDRGGCRGAQQPDRDALCRSRQRDRRQFRLGCLRALGGRSLGELQSTLCRGIPASRRRARGRHLSFTKAWQNILAAPSVVLSLLAHNALAYVRGLPAFVFNGYDGYMPIRVSAGLGLALIGALTVSTLVVNYRRSTRAEIWFWPLFFVTVAFSAARFGSWRRWLAHAIRDACADRLLPGDGICRAGNDDNARKCSRHGAGGPRP